MANLSKVFYIAEGATSDQAIGFQARSLRVDNPTNGWVLLDGEYQVGPLGFAYVQNLKPGRSQARLQVTLTSPGAVIATGNGQRASVTFYEEEQEPSATSYQTITAAISVTAGTQEQVRSGAGVSTDVGYRAADLAQPVYILAGAAGNSAPLTTLAGTNAAASQVDGHSSTIGTTTGAAVVTNANGTIQQYLRGLVAIFASVLDSLTRLLVMPKYNYTYIAAGQATTVIKATPGVLHTLTIHAAATATNTTTVYDNASGAGTIIALPAATTATVPITLTFDVAFGTGLVIITAVANGAPMTVSWL